MKKFFLVLAIAFGMASALLLAGRMAGVWKLYTTQSISNEPTLMHGDHFIITTLKKPVKNALIGFRVDGEAAGPAIYVHRLVATGGDKVEVKDGVLWVNDINTDTALNLSREYMVRADEPFVAALPESHVHPFSGPYVLATLSDDQARLRRLGDKRYVQPAGMRQPDMEKKWGKRWNPDQFGPVRVPAGCYFVLGDNRHNALDSRYLGFITADRVVGVLIGR